MSLPLTNVKLSDVLVEFGAPASTALSAMLKGGTYVPSDVVGGTIPSALPISLSSFAGSRKPGNLVLDGAEILGDAGALTVTGSGLSRSYVVDIAKSSGLSDVECSATLRVRFNIDGSANPQAVLMSGPGATLSGGYYDQFNAGSFDGLLVSPSPYLTGATVVSGVRNEQALIDSSGSSTFSASIGSPISDGFDSTSREIAATVSGSQLVLDFPLTASIHISTNDVPFGVGASIAGSMQCTFNYNIRVKDGGVTIGTFAVTFNITVGVSVSAQATGA